MLHNLRYRVLHLWSHEWWMLGLMSLTVLFMLLFGLFIMSYKVLKRNMGHVYPVFGALNMSASTGDVNAFDTRTGLSLGVANVSRTGVDRWVTRLFIAIVLQCAALYLMSQFPGMKSPFWLGIVLQGFTYGSAALFYASGGGDEEVYQVSTQPVELYSKPFSSSST